MLRSGLWFTLCHTNVNYVLQQPHSFNPDLPEPKEIPEIQSTITEYFQFDSQDSKVWENLRFTGSRFLSAPFHFLLPVQVDRELLTSLTSD